MKHLNITCKAVCRLAAAVLSAGMIFCLLSCHEKEAEKTGDIMILYTSDVHCGVDEGFGYAGLKQIRKSLEAKGYETILVDDGDSIQGANIGALDNGETIIGYMNDLGYDVAIPGNHEFDYGVDQFLKLTEKAEFPYISCNFVREDKLVFRPYVIKEKAGKKIAFVGVTTPTTITSSTPKFFQNDKGEYIYGFMRDQTGEAVYNAVQNAVDSARADGAELVYLMGHLGLAEDDSPWTYADILSHTSGIDVMLDGHSHDTEQVVMKNKDGYDVTRSACGTKMGSIGYSHITPEGKVEETGIWSWNNAVSVPEILGIDNEIGRKITDRQNEIKEELSKKIGTTEYELTISDPEAVDASGKPIRMVRRAETNLGDLVTDAIRVRAGADIGIVGGGGIRVTLPKGDLTVNDMMTVLPFGNRICVVKATGQQILDALESGASAIPGEYGGFLHVSGMSYEVDSRIKSSCVADADGMLSVTKGKRRVSNVKVGGEPIDAEKIYTVAGANYTLLFNGDGQTAFDDAEYVKDIGLDYVVVSDFIEKDLHGVIGSEYADPFGQGRIIISD